ncbi:MAG: capsid staple protein [Sterolibacterium sp.]
MRTDSPCFGAASVYPYGLCICLGQEELDKLGLTAECEVGDFLHVFALAKVTSVSTSDTGEGEKSRIELTITHMGVEDEEDEQAEVKFPKHKLGSKRPY